MTTMAIEVPCPKCGQKNYVDLLRAKYGIYIRCSKCDAKIEWLASVHPLLPIAVWLAILAVIIWALAGLLAGKYY